MTAPSQPYFLPGYTGWTPLTGPKRHFVIGETYGHYTHDLLHGHRVGGGRLNPVTEDIRFINTFPYPPHQDPRFFLDNPHKPLDPYFMPGYTGWTPGSAIKRTNAIGDTYGRMTHTLLAKHRVGGDRLRPVNEQPREYVLEEEEVKFYCNKHEVTGNEVRRRFNMVPGYTGHVPRAQFRYGKTRNKTGREGTADFERIMERKTAMAC
ncbi:ciliary microtubule inner protein 2B-like [Parasteatoda tepidariorum]|uniref:ciliary microtubule inner protein 2B-like n=1 Tax=Parasteatoda tepidariorum TaxID=114398 RepID=UPI00077F9CAE|nr:protein FAM166B-like [Parasteatoda tepidariorum]